MEELVSTKNHAPKTDLVTEKEAEVETYVIEVHQMPLVAIESEVAHDAMEKEISTKATPVVSES